MTILYYMKLEDNWRNKTIENLEKGVWPKSDFDSLLISKTQALRKITLDKFTTEDLRIMIGQEIGLDYLIPLVLEVLTEDLWTEGDFFEGDLLKNVLAIKTEFWNNNVDHWLILNELIKDKRSEIKAQKFDVANFDSSIHKLL